MEYLDAEAGWMLKAGVYPVPAEMAWPSFLQALPLEHTSLSSPHTRPDVPPRETAQYSSRAVTSRPQ